MSKALKIKEGTFINMDHIIEWEVDELSLSLFIGTKSMTITVSDEFPVQEVNRIHRDLCEYMGASVESLKQAPTLGQAKHLKVDAQDTLALTQMDEMWQPNHEVAEFVLKNKIPKKDVETQLTKFKHFYIHSGKPAMFWDARFISWLQRALAINA